MHMLNRKAFQSQSGQVAVVVFLIMAVMLVVGLSLASRTSQEIELAGQQEDTTRVFNAAETGIEEALSEEGNFTGGSLPADTYNDTDTKTLTTVKVDALTGFENTFQSGETATVFINQLSTQKPISIDWTNENNEATCGSVLVISVYYEASGNIQVQHLGVRPPSCPTFDNTNFTVASDSPSGTDYRYRYSFNLPAYTSMIRIKPLKGATSIAVSSTDNSVLASQTYSIRSEAQDTLSGNTEVRAIQVTRTKPAPPAILDYALYSGGTLSK